MLDIEPRREDIADLLRLAEPLHRFHEHVDGDEEQQHGIEGSRQYLLAAVAEGPLVVSGPLTELYR